jgi:hypothetical protein
MAGTVQKRRTAKSVTNTTPQKGVRKSTPKRASQNNPFDIVELVARSSSVKMADGYISTRYPDYTVKDKYTFLKKNFKFQPVSGSDGIEDVSCYYGLMLQSILGKVRDFGIDYVKKSKNKRV